jgi:hypothetical protein
MMKDYAAKTTHMLQCLSNARTRPSSLCEFLKFIRTVPLVLTLRMSIDRGPFAS